MCRKNVIVSGSGSISIRICLHILSIVSKVIGLLESDEKIQLLENGGRKRDRKSKIILNFLFQFRVAHGLWTSISLFPMLSDNDYIFFHLRNQWHRTTRLPFELRYKFISGTWNTFCSTVARHIHCHRNRRPGVRVNLFRHRIKEKKREKRPILLFISMSFSSHDYYCYYITNWVPSLQIEFITQRLETISVLFLIVVLCDADIFLFHYITIGQIGIVKLSQEEEKNEEKKKKHRSP